MPDHHAALLLGAALATTEIQSLTGGDLEGLNATLTVSGQQTEISRTSKQLVSIRVNSIPKHDITMLDNELRQGWDATKVGA